MMPHRSEGQDAGGRAVGTQVNAGHVAELLKP